MWPDPGCSLRQGVLLHSLWGVPWAASGHCRSWAGDMGVSKYPPGHPGAGVVQSCRAGPQDTRGGKERGECVSWCQDHPSLPLPVIAPSSSRARTMHPPSLGYPTLLCLCPVPHSVQQALRAGKQLGFTLGEGFLPRLCWHPEGCHRALHLCQRAVTASLNLVTSRRGVSLG